MAYKPKIFLVGAGKDELITLEETGYVTESVLQDLLVNYPDLLAGDQIDPENPRRWLLVAQEMGVPGGSNENDRWSLDHLFLDQDGVPTFVECKRATDTRARREVVAQMLDYAANGVEYWSMEHMRQAATETANDRHTKLDEDIAALTNDGEVDVEAFWENVETNLRGHRVRLVFVADSIPRELRRLVEFLNEDMSKVEVLAVEVKQYQRPDGTAHKALVPRVLGMTETARSTKQSSATAKPKLTQEQFLEACTNEARGFFERVLDLAKQKGHTIYFGSAEFSLRVHVPPDDTLGTFARGVPPDEFRFCFQSAWVKHTQGGWHELRKRLLDFGVLDESGAWSLVAKVTKDNRQLLDQAYDFILEKMDEFKRLGE